MTLGGLCRQNTKYMGVILVEVAYLVPGEERYKTCADKYGKEQVEYSYRAESGELFSCVSHSLEEAYALCEDWLMRRHRG